MLLKHALAVASRVARSARARRFARLEVGEGSRVNFLRVRPAGDNTLLVGSGSYVGATIAFERPGSAVRIGRRSFVGSSLIAAAGEVEIGDDVLIAWGVTVADHNAHSVRFSERANDVREWLAGRKDWSVVGVEPVRVRDKAWIGFGSIVLKGVTIGEGAVVGAGSVVTRDVAPWTVVAGNPARPLRTLGVDER